MSGNSFFRYLILWLSTVHIAFAQDGNDFVIGKVFEIESEILNERREYIVSLPASYEGDGFYIDKKYPVLILLDGRSWFHLASGMIQSMSSGAVEQIPEMIVVAIRNTNRDRDFLPDPPGVQEGATDGGSKKFRAFLEKELLPAITSRYRTSNCKILVGHSYGGLFAVESLLEKSGFSAYLAIDPSLWYGDELMNKKAVEIFEKDKKLAASIYVSQSNNPFNEGIEASKLGRGIQGFKRVLDTSEVDGLRYQFKFFENEDHFSIPLITMYEGLQFIFDGYKYPLNKIVGKRAQEIKDHYQDMASRFGGDLLPPGKVLNQVGLFLIRNQDQMKEAIQILEFNKESYPNSYVPYHSLGEGYRVIGDKRKALENYKKSIELNPNNQEARVRIGELEKDK